MVMENILVIGNGFDIAHGFNTRYEDFINFCKTIATVYQGFKDNQFIYQNEYNDILKEKLDKINQGEVIPPEKKKSRFLPKQ
mgnify:CR=1 FL=1